MTELRYTNFDLFIPGVKMLQYSRVELSFKLPVIRKLRSTHGTFGEACLYANSLWDPENSERRPSRRWSSQSRRRWSWSAGFTKHRKRKELKQKRHCEEPVLPPMMKNQTFFKLMTDVVHLTAPYYTHCRKYKLIKRTNWSYVADGSSSHKRIS